MPVPAGCFQKLFRRSKKKRSKFAIGQDTHFIPIPPFFLGKLGLIRAVVWPAAGQGI